MRGPASFPLFLTLVLKDIKKKEIKKGDLREGSLPFLRILVTARLHSVRAAIILNVVIKSLHCIGRIVASRPLVSGEGARETLAKVFFVSMTESL